MGIRPWVSWPAVRASSSPGRNLTLGRPRCYCAKRKPGERARLDALEEKIGQQLVLVHTRLTVFCEIGLACGAQHVLVDAELACELAARLCEYDVRGVGDNLGPADSAPLRGWLTAQGNLQSRGADNGSRPERIHCDPARAQLSSQSEHTKTHAVLAQGVGDVRREPMLG